MCPPLRKPRAQNRARNPGTTPPHVCPSVTTVRHRVGDNTETAPKELGKVGKALFRTNKSLEIAERENRIERERTLTLCFGAVSLSPTCSNLTFSRERSLLLSKSEVERRNSPLPHRAGNLTGRTLLIHDVLAAWSIPRMLLDDVRLIFFFFLAETFGMLPIIRAAKNRHPASASPRNEWWVKSSRLQLACERTHRWRKVI